MLFNEALDDSGNGITCGTADKMRCVSVSMSVSHEHEREPLSMSRLQVADSLPGVGHALPATQKMCVSRSATLLSLTLNGCDRALNASGQ